MGHKHSKTQHKPQDLDVADWVGGFTVGDVVNSKKSKGVICVDGEETVRDVLALFAAHGIMSAPMIQNDQVAGIVRLFDLVTCVVFQKALETLASTVVHHQSTVQWAETYLAENCDAFTNQVQNTLGLSKESEQLWEFEFSDSLSKLTEAFSQGVHRVLVKSRASPLNKFTFFVSQTDVVRFLLNEASDMPELAHVMKKTIAESNLGTSAWSDGKPPMFLSEKVSALQGFRYMKLHDLQALPVVDADGQVIDTISISDLRGINERTLARTLLPVREFLKVTYGINNYECVTCTSDNTLSEVMDMMLQHRIHRVWKVDSNNKLEGVVSLTDVLNKFSPFDYYRQREQEEGAAAAAKDPKERGEIQQKQKKQPHQPAELSPAEKEAELLKLAEAFGGIGGPLFEEATYTFPSVELPKEIEFDSALELVRAAFEKSGFGVPAGSTDLHLHDVFKKKGVDDNFRETHILGVCNPKIAHKMLTSEIGTAVFLPCNVVTARNTQTGRIEVTAVDPGPFAHILTRGTDLRPTIEHVRELLQDGLELVARQAATWPCKRKADGSVRGVNALVAPEECKD